MFKKKKPTNNLDIDIRFLLANERTLLAWIRTGLTLIAGGVAVAFIATESRAGIVAGAGAIAFGGLLSIIGYIRYIQADHAIKHGELPATGIGGLLVVVGVILFSVALLFLRDSQLFQ